ncbi:helix-turn-helix transcriptional regulator [Spirosoma pollinicola]|uniref:AraC family transcriptional regulator n=1 Tax=Spirosoma pollinicola TaxID=2057025 RepID=A0A2K8YWA6_9BACT|nr:helix-turn-helix transcriptional regulator [Spirosoma pollinicola]AUD01912.1 AraC family transcriptional regulator [Spirosoma pollinicola]
MFYKKYQPSAHLTPYVACYYVWEHSVDPSSGSASDSLQIESPPTGFGSFVFNLGTPYRVEASLRNPFQVVPEAFLTGQATRQYRLYLSGAIHMVGIVFQPAGISSLFGLPMVEFANERVALADALGNSVQFLTEQLAEAPDYPARVAILDQFLSFQLLKRNLLPDRIDHSANQIVAHRGIININALVDDAFLCRRQFERKFLQRVGVSPKYYARIRRISYLCAQLASQSWQIADWQDLVFRCGYYDQSHFIKEFTEFTGKNPSAYVRNNVELANYLTT